MALICLFDPYGSGKSTLVKFFRSYLLSRGVYAHISWFRGFYLPASLAAKFFPHFTIFKKVGNFYYGVIIPNKLRTIYTVLLFKEVSFSASSSDRRLWYPRLHSLDHRNADRLRFLNSLLGAFLAGLAFMGTAIYVTADPNVLRKRAPNTPYSFLLGKSACYDVLTKYYASHTIDTILQAASRS